MDTLTFEGASALAAKIRRYWIERGYIVETRLERVRITRDEAWGGVLWCVRSNLMRGRPL